MNCTDSELNCELERIADSLESEGMPWLDFTSGVVVPVLLGLLTLLVAVISVRTARDGVRLNRAMHEEKLDRERREKRMFVSAELSEWLGHALFQSKTEKGRAALVDAADRARGAVDRSVEPHTKALYGWLLDDVHRPLVSDDRNALAEKYSRDRSAIDEWAEDPESFVRARKADASLSALLSRAEGNK